MTTGKPPVTIVGAGIVGICCGLTLQDEGHPVTIIDPRSPGTSTSYGNAGLVGGSMIMPISSPGLWKKLPWMLFSPMSPMKLRWSYLPQALPWLARFLSEGRTHTTRIRAREIATLNTLVVDAHLGLIRGHQLDAGLFRPTGTLQLYRDKKAAPPDKLTEEMHVEHGIRMDVLSADELYQMEPGLARDFEAATYYPEVGHVSTSIALSEAYAGVFRARGGQFVRETVRGFEVGPSGPRKVITDLGMHEVDHLVIAAGAWSRKLTRMLGTDVSLDTERGYHLNVAWTDSVTLNRPVYDTDYYSYIVPMSDGVRVTSGAEIGGLDLPPDFTRIRRVLGKARRTVKGLDGEVTREWMGYRPSTPDSKPIIDRSPNFSNLFFAFGHGHSGLTQSAATGLLLSDLVAGREPRIDLRPFSASRF